MAGSPTGGGGSAAGAGLGEEDEPGLVWAYRVDAEGRGEPLDWADLVEAVPGETDGAAYRWIHLDLDDERARSWLRDESGLEEVAAEALLAEETRPRATPLGGGLVLILRGVNLNPGEEPDDMVSLRLWTDGRRVLSVRRRRLRAVDDARARIHAGQGATSVAELLADIAEGLSDRTEEVLGAIDESLDAYEIGEGFEDGMGRARRRVRELRRQAIVLRRYIGPQRDALARVVAEPPAWLVDVERTRLREVIDRTTRFVEDLETARERASMIQEEIAGQLADELNRRMYALSIIAGIFLPLSFLTGLLGINVAGMWGTEADWAFDVVVGILVVLGVIEVVLFRRLRWL